MSRINIRCCCNCNLLLGTVEVPVRSGWRLVSTERTSEVDWSEVQAGDRYTFPLSDGSKLTLDVEEVRSCIQMTPEMAAQANFPAKVTRVLTELALKSDDTPLERLRLIPSFIEINQIRRLEDP